MFLKGEFSNRLVQVSLFSALVYYITAYPIVFEKARKYFPVKFKKTHHLLIFHTFVFAVLMYVLTYFVFDPIVRVVEGGPLGENDSDEGVGGEDEDIVWKTLGIGKVVCNDDDSLTSIGSAKVGHCSIGGSEFRYTCNGNIESTADGGITCTSK
jgi:hypothetical protein